MKQCTKCNIEKSLDKFHKRKISKDGHKPICKQCYKNYFISYYKKNSDQITTRNKTYYANTLEHRRAYDKKRYLIDPSRKLRNKKYYEDHKSDIIAKKCQKRRDDPLLRLNHSISNSIRKSLKSNKAGRKWENIVDYTLQDLVIHLELQFKRGMAWDNYGEWHIDHIKPQSKFSTDQIKKCWSLSNLQPLWAEENLRKGDR